MTFKSVIRLIQNEGRKLLAYRLDFFINYLVAVVFHFLMAYVIWKYIFDVNQYSDIRGMSLKEVLFYYFFANNLAKISQGEGLSAISNEIYLGGLNKFITYPTNFFIYKYITYLTHSFIYSFQGIFLLGVFYLIFGSLPIDIWTLPYLFVAILFSCTLYFLMNAILECIAFWVDAVWSLTITLRMLSNFFNGALIPLVFFPGEMKAFILKTPFACMIHFPTMLVQGKLTTTEIFTYFTLSLLYICLMVVVLRFVWNRGSRVYTGVGI